MKVIGTKANVILFMINPCSLTSITLIIYTSLINTCPLHSFINPCPLLCSWTITDINPCPLLCPLDYH